jgi:hypothetical protein
MGFFLKNRRLESGGSAVIVPTGDTALRPNAPVNGSIRYNTDNSRFEIYYNAWKQIAIIGNVAIVKDTFTGDGSTTTYTLSVTPSTAQAIKVYVGNVHQNPGTAYNTVTSSLNFTSAPPSGQTVEVYHNFASTDAN